MISRFNRYKYFTIFVLVFYLFSIFSIIIFPYNVNAIITQYDAIDAISSSCNKDGAVWATVRDSATAHSTADPNTAIGAYKSGATYYIYRCYLRFSTLDIDAGATISNCTINFNVISKGAGSHTIYAIDGDNAGGDSMPEPENNEPDYDRDNWGAQLGSVTISATGSTNLYITENLTSAVNTSGNTTIYLIYSLDYSDTTPTLSTTYLTIGNNNAKMIIDISSGSEQDIYNYCPIGDFTGDVGTDSGFKFKYFEGIYEVLHPTEMIKQIDVGITNTQYNYESNATNYYLVLNGNMFQGSYFTAETFKNGIHTHSQKVVSFSNIDVTLQTKVPKYAIGFKHNGDWDIWQSILLAHYDVNKDKVPTACKFHSNYYQFQDDLYNGDWIYGYELVVRIWYECFEQDLEDFVYDFDTDTVFISPASNGSLEFLTGDPINYIVYSMDMSTQPYIIINKDESTYETIKMISPLEPRIFTAKTSGSYNITLVRGGDWKAGKNFTVYGIDADNYLYCIPAKSHPYTNVRIYYNYTSGSGYDGRLIVSKSEIFTDTSKYYTDFVITENGSGYRTFQPNAEGKYYIYLCVIYPNNRTYELARITHPCYFEYPNDLTGYQDVWLGDENNIAQTNTQKFIYSHNFVLWDVVIKANGQVIAHVGDKPKGEYLWKPIKSGLYNSTLELLTDEGYICLAYFVFSAHSEAYFDQYTDNDASNFFDRLIPEDYQFILALGIIAIAIFSPFYIVRKYKVKNIPNILFLITGVCGLAFDIWAGLLDFWAIVLFVFVFSSLIVWNILGQLGAIGGSTQTGGEDFQAIEGSKYRSRYFQRKESEKARKK